MSVVLQRPTWWQRLRPLVFSFDPWLLLAIGCLAAIGLVTMYSAGFDHGTRFVDHGRNMLLAMGVMLLVAQVSPQRMLALAVPLYLVGLALLVLVALPGIGIHKKGATRWLDVGVVIQPSEIMKIAMPLMLAWWFQRREGAVARNRFRQSLPRCCWCRWAWSSSSPIWAPRC